MKKVLLAVSAVIAFASTASAADMRAPVYKAMAPVSAYNWTGFYLGVNAGIGVGEQPTSLRVGVFSGSEFTQSPIGAIGGVQAGYNWQFGNWVLGLETDIQASGLKDDAACLLTCVAGQQMRIEQSLGWFGTARARVGYTTGPVLAYYTGGFAYGGVKSTINETLAGGTGVFGFDDTMTGWTLGSGVEASLGGNWTGKLEYLYLDLGNGGTAYTVGGTAHVINSDIRSHIFRAGVNYRIGGTPVAASYPTANWTGLYVGANAGSGFARNESNLTTTGPLINESFVSAPRGFVGGAQIGYNWQTSNIVFGLEADFQGSSLQNDNCVVFCQTGVGGGTFARFDQSMPWFGTVRGRVGFATGPALLYVTGGLAYGKIETDIFEQVLGVPGSFSFSETKAGWTIGGGVEQPFTLFGLLPGNNWTLKTEYLYVDLGSTSNTYTLAGLPHTFTTEATSHIFRTGINYHFNAGPVVAKY
jgi:outer membrane immunogenic protein